MAAPITASSKEIKELRQRMCQLESEMKELRETIEANGKDGAKPWWREIAGRFDGDPIFEQVVKEGRKWRLSQRPKKKGRRANS